MRPSKVIAGLVAFALVVMAPVAALAGPKPVKSWNIYQDKLGAFTVSTAVPKGQSLVAGSFGTRRRRRPIWLRRPSAVDGRHPGR